MSRPKQGGKNIRMNEQKVLTEITKTNWIQIAEIKEVDANRSTLHRKQSKQAGKPRKTRYSISKYTDNFKIVLDNNMWQLFGQ